MAHFIYHHFCISLQYYIHSLVIVPASPILQQKWINIICPRKSNPLPHTDNNHNSHIDKHNPLMAFQFLAQKMSGHLGLKTVFWEIHLCWIVFVFYFFLKAQCHSRIHHRKSMHLLQHDLDLQALVSCYFFI